MYRKRGEVTVVVVLFLVLVGTGIFLNAVGGGITGAAVGLGVENLSGEDEMLGAEKTKVEDLKQAPIHEQDELDALFLEQEQNVLDTKVLAQNLDEVHIQQNVDACTTITEDAVLTANISGNSTGINGCLTVGASNIEVDGAGYYLIGNGSGAGIRSLGQTNVTIKNFGGIENFTTGIWGPDHNTTIHNNSINSSTGIFANARDDINITSNSIEGDTIALDIANSGAARLIVAYNNISSFGGTGISIDGTDHVLQNNIINVSNSALGITIPDTNYENNVTLQHNTFTFVNITEGFDLHLNKTVIENNTIIFTNGSVLFNISDGHNQFIENTLTWAGDVTVYHLASGANNTIINDTANGDPRVLLRDGFGTWINPTYDDFTNRTADTGPDGNITLQWYVTANVTSPTGIAAHNITVSALALSTGGLVQTLVTPTSGLALFTLTEFTVNDTVLTTYDSYTLNGTQTGLSSSTYFTNSTTVNITETNSTTIQLVMDELVCGSIVGESFNLSRNLVCNGTAITINASNITIGGVNYQIEGNGSGNGLYLNFDAGSGIENATIQNLRIANFTTAIYDPTDALTNFKGINITVTNSSYGIDVKCTTCDFINSSMAFIHTGFKLQTGSAAATVLLDKVDLHADPILAEIAINATNTISNLTLINTLLNTTANNSDLSFTDGIAWFVNSTAEYSRITVEGGEVYLQWYAVVNVTNTTQSVVNDTTVTAYFPDGTIDDIAITDNSGMATLRVTDILLTPTATTNITATTLTANKSLFQSNSTSITFHESRNVNLTLTNQPCGSTIYGDVLLGSNITTSGTCFTVGADNIVIDGNGHWILSGDGGGGSNSGITVSHRNNVTIQNINIQNVTTGIAVNFSTNLTVMNSIIDNTSAGMIINGSNNTRIISTTFSNFLFPISMMGEGNSSLINGSFDISSAAISGNATLFQEWFVNVNVTINDTNQALSSVGVYGLFNSTGLLDNYSFTQSTGLGQLELVEKERNATTTTIHTPHTIIANFTFSGTLLQNQTTINLTQTNNTLVNLSLNVSCQVPTDDFNITSDVTLCPGTYNLKDTNEDGILQVQADNVNITCSETSLSELDASAFTSTIGVVVSDYENVTVSGCTISGYDTSINLTRAHGFRLLGSTYSGDAKITHTNDSLFDNFTAQSSVKSIALHVDASSHNTFTNGYVDGVTGAVTDYGVYFDYIDTTYSSHNWVENLTILEKNVGVYVDRNCDSNCMNNTVINNSFSDNTVHVFADSSELNLNISSGAYARGNIYDDYCDEGKDLNSDGYADNVTSISAADWPYNSTVGDVSGTAVDYGPWIQSCPSVVQSGSGGGGGSSKTTTAASEPAASSKGSPSPKPKETLPEDVYSANEAAQFLEQKVTTSKIAPKVTQIAVTLENTGTKKMLLFPQISQETQEPFFMVTRKTLGFEGSFFHRLVGLAYSRQPITGRLLKAELTNPEELVLNPGEKIETTLELSEGLVVPRQIKIQFTTLGDTVFEQDVEITQQAISGAAIDVDTTSNLVDVYSVIVPQEAAQEYAKHLESANGVTGAVIGDATTKQNAGKNAANQYYVELTLHKKESKSVVFAELYGPFDLKQEQTFIFAQQLSYDPSIFNGNYVVQAKTFRAGEVLVENEFDVVLE